MSNHTSLSSADSWPDHWGGKRRVDADRYYKALPECFYQMTSLLVVTPTNAKQWLQRISALKLTNKLHHHLDLQEYFSGSSRLSFTGFKLGLRVGFPVDHRYGWDTTLADHQSILDEIQQTLGISVQYFSPRSSPWAKANTTSKAESKSRSRAEEQSTLQWVTKRCQQCLKEK